MKFIWLLIGNWILSSVYSQQVCNNIEVALIVDVSGTIKGFPPTADFVLIKNIVKSIIRKVDISKNDNRVTITRFATEAEVMVTCSDHNQTESLLDAVDDLPNADIGSLTNTEAGLTKGSESLSSNGCGERPNTNQLIVILSDGKTNVGTNNSIDPLHNLAESLRKQGVTLVTVAIGNHNIENLIKITGDEDLVYTKNNYDDILKLEILEDGCIIPKSCSCALSQNIKLPTKFSKYDVITSYEGTCYLDKLKAAIENITAEIEEINRTTVKLKQCKNETKEEIIRKDTPNMEAAFEKYRNCTLNVQCTLRGYTFLLQGKLQAAKYELKLEEKGFGDFYIPGYVDWVSTHIKTAGSYVMNSFW